MTQTVRFTAASEFVPVLKRESVRAEPMRRLFGIETGERGREREEGWMEESKPKREGVFLPFP